MKKLITELLLRDIEKLISEQLKKYLKKFINFAKRKKERLSNKNYYVIEVLEYWVYKK